MRELELACLGIDVEQLHLNLVAFLDASFLYGLQTFPVDFADMEQTILARHELHEAAVWHH